MATSHSFNFAGGERLSIMGATWFVSYTYYRYIDADHKNWDNVSTWRRIDAWEKSRWYHLDWLQEIITMNDNKLNTNQIGLHAYETKIMAQILLKNGLEEELSIFHRFKPKSVSAEDEFIDKSENITSTNKAAEYIQLYKLEAGKTVMHNKFGEGKITYMYDDEIVILFNSGDKRIFNIPHIFEYNLVKVIN